MSLVVPHFDFRVDVAAEASLGRRPHLEDAHLLATDLSLFAVADGMGGHAAGEIAARLAIEELSACIRSSRAQRAIQNYTQNPSLDARRKVFSCLRWAIEQANQKILEESSKNPEQRGMGTTLDVAWLARDRAFLAHAGDGRIYLSRPAVTLQITQDHAQLESLKASGEIHASAKAGGQNRLLNALGLKAQVAVDTLFVVLSPSDRLLLCSDGVHGPLSDEAQLAQLMRRGTASSAASQLVSEATRGGHDNATALIISVQDRFVRRPLVDPGLSEADLNTVRYSPLFLDLSWPQMLNILSAGVEVELGAEELIPQAVTNDLVAYIILDGSARLPNNKECGPGALLFAESLVDVPTPKALPTSTSALRLWRLRSDDFQELCASNPELASQLYCRLAKHLARRLAQ